MKKGELKFELHGEKLSGKWALVKIKGDDPKAWLLVKDKDEHSRPADELDIVERTAGEHRHRARPRRGGGRARPALALEGGRAKGARYIRGDRPRATEARGSASPTSKALRAGRCPEPSRWPSP